MWTFHIARCLSRVPAAGKFVHALSHIRYEKMSSHHDLRLWLFSLYMASMCKFLSGAHWNG